MPARTFPPAPVRRDASLKTWLTAEELRRFQARAQLARRTSSDYLRLIVLAELGEVSRVPEEVSCPSH